jgi:hypothetical protein
MRHLLEHREHLVRLAALFAGAALVFFAARAVLVPDDFGELGHYRAGALADAASRTAAFAGRASCLDCHGDAGDALHGGKHASVGCEACHGPLAAHAADPAEAKAVRPAAASLCPVCHERNVAKPRSFPQVELKEHAEGPCSDCHAPHRPEI